ncbi:PREDICTED: uncharacterized protein LOC109234113 [Nicotiana attenuata]|uniref:uncharacterized protein LOC109234113 n=1 Tax=Nicotiana attenuata TaxID=49451 RepID=UPI000904D9FE|nr:PREDICTED: uncharacterized protein LOC109234113 [Nicotiana attenuata]XP_019255505.1 PREDICTED: uncharacterized protein LOC109234113 [Nicotiana attenuata]
MSLASQSSITSTEPDVCHCGQYHGQSEEYDSDYPTARMSQAMKYPLQIQKMMKKRSQRLHFHISHEATVEISDENSVTAPAPVNRKRPRGGNAERWLEETSWSSLTFYMRI